MAQVYTFTDLNGEVRLSAEISPAPGGGYTAPITRAQYRGNVVNIANGSGAALTWDTLDSGTALLDLAVPTLPTIVTAGTYAVTVDIEGLSLTAAGAYDATLELDAAGEDPQVGNRSGVSVAGSTTVKMTIGLTYYVPAGGQISVLILRNLDGVAARDFQIGFAIVQRLS